MNENDKSRSGLQTAVDFAHAARAAKRIMQAAAVSGVHGAAAATAREAFPLLLKILIAALVVFIVVPMVIFTALPNIFFGYNSSGTDTVIQMTQQAMTLGGVYMTLGNFEGAQIDSVVTGIAAEYEKNGTTIDHIVVSSANSQGTFGPTPPCSCAARREYRPSVRLRCLARGLRPPHAASQ